MYVLVWVRVTLINDQNIKSNKANSKITMYKRLYAKSICMQWLTREWTVGLVKRIYFKGFKVKFKGTKDGTGILNYLIYCFISTTSKPFIMFIICFGHLLYITPKHLGSLYVKLQKGKIFLFFESSIRNNSFHICLHHKILHTSRQLPHFNILLWLL